MTGPVLAVLLGVFLLTWSGLTLRQQAVGNFTVPARALVVESSTQPASSAWERIWPRHHFAYRYLHRGELYVGRVYRQGRGSGEAVRRYAVGSTLTVWVDPNQPDKAVVETGPRVRDLALLTLGFVSLMVGIARFLGRGFIRRQCRGSR